jgi:hypothetical protein
MSDAEAIKIRKGIMSRVVGNIYYNSTGTYWYMLTDLKLQQDTVDPDNQKFTSTEIWTAFCIKKHNHAAGG